MHARGERGALLARILSFAEYAAVRHETPYEVAIARGAAQLLVIGVRHSSDPAEPMFDRIEAAFTALGPSWALHEGTPPYVEGDRERAIRKHGEAGLVRHLAARAGIETASLDIPLAAEATWLRREVGARAALVFLVLRQLASFNRKTARLDFDGYFADFFALIGPPLGVGPLDWRLVESEYRAYVGRPLSVRQVTALETDPMRDELPTQRIARRSNRLRDEHMLGVLLDTAAAHPRVFAAIGVAHAVMLEPALRAALEP